jgi:hypothetical protein
VDAQGRSLKSNFPNLGASAFSPTGLYSLTLAEPRFRFVSALRVTIPRAKSHCQPDG